MIKELYKQFMKKKYLILSSIALLCLPGCAKMVQPSSSIGETTTSNTTSNSSEPSIESSTEKTSSVEESSIAIENHIHDVYEIYFENGGTSSYQDWVEYASEVSDISSFEGMSSYQIYKAVYPGYTGDEATWLNDVNNKNLSITIAFDCNGGLDIDSIKLLKGEVIDLSKIESQKPGFILDGWMINGKICDPNFSSMISITLRASWVKLNVVITYYLDGKQFYKSQPNDFAKPIVPEKLGYEFAGWFLDEEMTIPFDTALEAKESFAVYGKYDYTDCNMPIIAINTDDGSDITSKYEYKPATVSIDNAEEKFELNNVAAEVRGRGNSTWTYSKKPYRIKFSKKQALFGCEKAKNWVLLADYLDPSSIRNYSALTFANTLPGLPYKYLTQHVRLYLNGQYKGLYLLTQNPDEKTGRVGIEQTITADTDVNTLDYMVEFDASVRENNVDILDVNYFISTGFSNKEISLKYPEIDDFTSEDQFKSFLARVRKEVNELGTIVNGGKYSEIAAKVDEQSLASFTVEDLLTGSRDHQKKSFKFYKKGEKFYFGPAWDYDYSTYVSWTGRPSVTTGSNGVVWSYTNICIEKYVSTTEGKSKVAAVWKEMRDSGKYAASIEAIKAEAALIADDANMNNNFWYGKNKYDNATAVKNVLGFYDNQTSVMDEYFGV